MMSGQLIIEGLSIARDGSLRLEGYVDPAPIPYRRICEVSRDGAITITELGTPPTRPDGAVVFSIPAAAVKYAREATTTRKSRSQSWDVTPRVLKCEPLAIAILGGTA